MASWRRRTQHAKTAGPTAPPTDVAMAAITEDTGRPPTVAAGAGAPCSVGTEAAGACTVRVAADLTCDAERPAGAKGRLVLAELSGRRGRVGPGEAHVEVDAFDVSLAGPDAAVLARSRRGSRCASTQYAEAYWRSGARAGHPALWANLRRRSKADDVGEEHWLGVLLGRRRSAVISYCRQVPRRLRAARAPHGRRDALRRA